MLQSENRKKHIIYMLFFFFPSVLDWSEDIFAHVEGVRLVVVYGRQHFYHLFTRSFFFKDIAKFIK